MQSLDQSEPMTMDIPCPMLTYILSNKQGCPCLGNASLNINDSNYNESSSLDPHKLGLKCLLNNYPMQDSCTEQLVFKTEACIEWISQFVTLEAGDVILTGTPPGVGVFKDPPVYLKPGDEVTCEIEGIGSITNPVIAEDV